MEDRFKFRAWINKLICFKNKENLILGYAVSSYRGGGGHRLRWKDEGLMTERQFKKFKKDMDKRFLGDGSYICTCLEIVHSPELLEGGAE